MPAPTAVFDLDGTLVDTAPDLLDSLNHCLVSEGMSPVAPTDLRHLVGMGGRVMIERAFSEQRRPIDARTLDRLLILFLEHYSANIPGRSQPFPGACEAMDRLAAAGFRLAVCTNKYEGLSVSLLTALGLAPRFAAICGADTFAFRKPDPIEAIMIGDSRTDIDTARAAGVPVIAVDFGYTDQPVEVFSPTAVISHFNELTVENVLQLIEAFSGGPRRASRI